MFRLKQIATSPEYGGRSWNILWGKKARAWLLADAPTTPPPTRRFDISIRNDVRVLLLEWRGKSIGLELRGFPPEWLNRPLEARFFNAKLENQTAWQICVRPLKRPQSPEMIFVLRLGNKLFERAEQLAGPSLTASWKQWLLEYFSGTRLAPPPAHVLDVYPSNHLVSLYTAVKAGQCVDMGPMPPEVTQVRAQTFKIKVGAHVYDAVRLEELQPQDGIAPAIYDQRLITQDSVFLPYALRWNPYIEPLQRLVEAEPHMFGMQLSAWLQRVRPGKFDMVTVKRLPTLEESTVSGIVKKGFEVTRIQAVVNGRRTRIFFLLSGLPDSWRGKELWMRCYGHVEAGIRQWRIEVDALENVLARQTQTLTFVLKEGEQYLSPPHPVLARKPQPRPVSPEDFKHLPWETEKALWQQYIADDRMDKVLCDRLVLSHLRLAQKMTYAFLHSKGVFEPDSELVTTLVDLCIEGFTRGAKTYDVESGNKFTTYASHWAFQRMSLYWDNLSSMPRYVAVAISKINRFCFVNALTLEELRNYSNDQMQALATELDETPGLLHEVLKPGVIEFLYFDNKTSLDQPVSEDGDTDLGDYVADEAELHDEILAKRSWDHSVADALDQFRQKYPVEARLIALSHGYGCEKMSLQEIGDHAAELGVSEKNVTRQRICQKLIDAKNLLRPFLKRRGVRLP